MTSVLLLLVGCNGGEVKVDGSDPVGPCADETAWPDADGDTYGDGQGEPFVGCAPPIGYVGNTGDCDDTDPEVNPGVDEDVCQDGLDADCDGVDRACGFGGSEDLSGGTILYGTNYEDAGRKLAVADLTGDGRDDLLVAARDGASAGVGGYVYAPETLSSGTLATVALVVESEWGLAGMGRSIGTGDLDGDGVLDMAFGEPSVAEPGMYIVSGPAQDGLSVADAIRVYGEEGDYAGHGGDVGDVDGDGVADVVVGAYTANDQLGGAFVALGPFTADVALHTDASGWFVGDGGLTGRWVHAGGDFDGDGADDILVASAATSEDVPFGGAVYMVYGPGLGELDLTVDFDGRYLGAIPGEKLGEGIGSGDLDGDGLDDVLAGSFGSDFAGAAYVFHGPAAGSSHTSEADIALSGDADSQLGSAFAVGDLDDDGDADLLVGGQGGGGGAWIFADLGAGSHDTTEAAASFPSVSGDDWAGAAVAIADLDADGRVEAIVGAPSMGRDGYEGGGVYIVEAH